MSFVKYEPKGNIAYLIIDREKALNALNSQVLADLDAALDAVDLSEIRCLIVRGAGEKSFVAGADIAQMKELSKEEAEAFGKQGNDVMRKLEAFPIPTIAAVGGYALGGGCEVALACDFRIAAQDAKLGQPEILLGIIPGAGGTQRLARLVGPARAKDLIFSGRFVGADEALAIGLVDEVVPADEVYAAARRRMTRYVAGPALALRAAKEAIDRGLETDLQTGLEIERMLFSGLFATQDRATGMASFVANGPGKATFSGT